MRRRTRAATRAVLLALLALAVPLAVAQQQEQQPVLVEPLDELDVETVRGRDVVLRFSLFNLGTRTSFFVDASAVDLEGWTLQAEPDRFFLDPRQTSVVNVTLRAEGRPAETSAGAVRFALVDSETGLVHGSNHHVGIHVTNAARVIDLFDNPLPPPLDNSYGVFLLDIVFWAIVGVGAFLSGDTLVRIATARAHVDVTKVIIKKLRWPVFALVVIFGLKQSIDVLPRNGFTTFATRFLAATAVGVVALYVVYRGLDAALFYYAAHIAPRTRSRMDDVLVPAIRKIAGVVLVIVALGWTLSIFGFNPSVLFGAAGIMGLVIAFAAQDTLSNFFSGVFLLLDRPFAEGDEIQLDTGEYCRVDRIGLRSTRLYHFRHNQTIILPNNQLASGRVVNVSMPDGRFRVNVTVNVTYDTDVEKLKAVCLRCAEAVEGRDPDLPVHVYVNEFLESAIQVLVRCHVMSPRLRRTGSADLRERLLKAFREEGIQVALPQRIVRVAPDAAAAAAAVSVPVQPPAPRESAEGRNR